ncbi:hypothetical protein JTE90_029516 [Oedothorax gibbosus]|uniref:Uncharacterized protein n=1 Tax=Oedothorax gibbosus TaxID=931172 RepID=A0AAV6UH60_9ARAC|nr:hypothetical protein JTE90_029516 [Oedothorax gibbosus]
MPITCIILDLVLSFTSFPSPASSPSKLRNLGAVEAPNESVSGQININGDLPRCFRMFELTQSDTCNRGAVAPLPYLASILPGAEEASIPLCR